MTATKIQQIRAKLNKQFVERTYEIDGTLMAMLAGEHCLFLGPPGTGKSALVRAVTEAMNGKYFERLLTKFSTPEELFGPVSLKGLENDKYVRVTAGKLPEAEVAFVDECFKANSAILNSLLTLMNERLFHNDGAPVRAPLVSLFGASNEMPDGKELEALWDRFMFRFDVSYVKSDANLFNMLTSTDADDADGGPSMTMAELAEVQKVARSIKVTEETVWALINLRGALIKEGFSISDRRIKKIMKILPVAAFMVDPNATETSPEDITALVDCLWRDPSERAKIARIVGQFADPVSVKANEILDAAREQYKAVQNTKGTADYKAHASKALDVFTEQEDKLAELAKSARRRGAQTVADATTEINAMHVEFSNVVAQNLRLRGLKIR